MEVINPELWQPAAARLRNILEDPEMLNLGPRVYHGFTACLALDAGFDAPYMTGAGTSASRLGSPDWGFLTLMEMHANAATIASLAPTDADVGFGSSLSVARTVASYIQSNVAALHIEDQTMMKAHIAEKQEFITRIRAASLARKQPGRDIVLIARTEPLQRFGFDEAVCRLKDAVKSGADVAILEGIVTEEQARDICRILAPTLCLLNIVHAGVTLIWVAQQAKDMGFRIMIWPLFSLTAVFNATKSALNEPQETGCVGAAKGTTGGIRDVFSVCGIDRLIGNDSEAGRSSLTGGV
ncbi:Nn.00g017600.m01.CDS01 [Neocucurbitaria sp. VM-36]